MDSASDEIPDELKEAWGKLVAGADARKFRRHLPALQRSVSLISGLDASLQQAFGGIKPEAVDQGERTEIRTALV